MYWWLCVCTLVVVYKNRVGGGLAKYCCLVLGIGQEKIIDL